MYRTVRMLIYLSLGLLCLKSHSQVKENIKICDDCLFLLEPLVDFQLCLGMEKDEVLKNFDSYSIVATSDTLIIEPGLTHYEVRKKFTIRNEVEMQFTGNMIFKKDCLSRFELNFPISSNPFYIEELKTSIAEMDTLNLNSFIYKSEGRRSNTEKNGSCTKSFLWRRNLENTKIYELNIDYYKN